MLTLSIVKLDGLDSGYFLYVFDSENLTNKFYRHDWINQKEVLKEYKIPVDEKWKLNNLKIVHIISVIPNTIYYGWHLDALINKITEYKAKYNFTLLADQKIPDIGLDCLDHTFQLKTLDQIAALIVRTHVQEVIWKLKELSGKELHSFTIENAKIVSTFPKSYYS